MKKKMLFIVSTLVLLALTGASVWAQDDVNGSGWWSAVQVQRTGNATGSAEVVMTAYGQPGETAGPWECGTRTLAEFGSAANFFPHWAGDPAGGNCADVTGFPASYEGGSVLSASDAFVAIVQSQNISFGGWAPGEPTKDGRAVAAYAGVSAPSTSIRFPVYKFQHSNENTTFYIQNADDSAANIRATFKPCSSCLGYADGPYTYDYTGLEAGKMVVIDASLAKNAAGTALPSGTGSYGGLSIESTNEQLLAGAYFEHHVDAAPAVYLKATRGFAEADADTVAYVPALKYQYPAGSTAATSPNASKWSGLAIHNADTVAVSIDITYTLSARGADGAAHADVGTKYTQNIATLAAGESEFVLFHDGLLAGVTGPQQRDLLSAKIVASGKIVAIVNEEGDYAVTGVGDKALYSAVPAKMASMRVSLPAYKEQYNGKFHGAVVMNVGTADADIEATLTVAGVSGGYTSESGTLAAGDTVKIKPSAAVAANSSVTFYMVCKDYENKYDDVATGDSGDMAALCVTATGASNPTGGVNTGMLIESTQPVVVLANEELLWYAAPSSAGDGNGEDASNYEGFPLGN